MASTPSGLPTYLLCQRCATRIGTLAKANNPCGYWEKWRRWDSNPRPPACKISRRERCAYQDFPSSRANAVRKVIG